jgi:hypothetical protein
MIKPLLKIELKPNLTLNYKHIYMGKFFFIIYVLSKKKKWKKNKSKHFILSLEILFRHSKLK